MVVAFKFKSNVADVNKRMSNMVARQMPFAVSKALNETAKTLVAKNKQDMRLAFDNATPFTLNAFYFRYARKYENSVTIRRKDMQRGRHYLEVQEDGGRRPNTASETNFKMNLAWPGQVNYITPTRATPRLKNGAISRGFMNQVMSQLQVQRDKAANTPSSRKSASKYFVPSIDHPLGQGIRAGVYMRTPAGNAKKMLNFTTRTPIYRKKTQFSVKMNAYGRAVYPKKMKAALKFAMATARLR